MNLDEKAAALKAALANVLREKRIAAGLSKTRLAEQAGLAFQTIAFIEKAERKPTVDTVMRVATAMGTTASALIAEAEKRAKSGLL